MACSAPVHVLPYLAKVTTLMQAYLIRDKTKYLQYENFTEDALISSLARVYTDYHMSDL